MTIDYNAELTWEQVMAAEKAANEVIWQDTPVDITFPAPDALARLNYRSKKALTGQVRIVAFPGADCCACCAPTCAGPVRWGLSRSSPAKSFGRVRLEILCGSRAYRYLSQVYDQDRAVAQLLSVKPQDTLAAAERQAEELAAAKQRMTELEDQLFSLRAQALTDREICALEPPRGRTEPESWQTQPQGLRRSGGGVRGSGVLLRLCPCPGRWGGHLSPGEAAERRSFRPGWRRNGFAQGSVQADRTAIYDFFRKEGIECPTC
ncbi:MAG: hypothetical protein ACLTYN_10160 [Dysosmobacter welbionis]